MRLEPVACGLAHRCVNGSIVESELPTVPAIKLAVASTVAPQTMPIEAGATTVLLFVRSLASTLDAADPLAAATAALENAESAGASRVLAEHVAGWRAIWDEGTVEVEGDPELAAAIDGALYNILSSTRADFPYGLSPGGLASDGYHGHVFWDQESWMWPPLNHLHPALAGSLLLYRFAEDSLVDRGARATENAQSYVYGSKCMHAPIHPPECAQEQHKSWHANGDEGGYTTHHTLTRAHTRAHTSHINQCASRDIAASL